MKLNELRTELLRAVLLIDCMLWLMSAMAIPVCLLLKHLKIGTDTVIYKLYSSNELHDMVFSVMKICAVIAVAFIVIQLLSRGRFLADNDERNVLLLEKILYKTSFAMLIPSFFVPITLFLTISYLDIESLLDIFAEAPWLLFLTLLAIVIGLSGLLACGITALITELKRGFSEASKALHRARLSRKNALFMVSATISVVCTILLVFIRLTAALFMPETDLAFFKFFTDGAGATIFKVIIIVFSILATIFRLINAGLISASIRLFKRITKQLILHPFEAVTSVQSSCPTPHKSDSLHPLAKLSPSKPISPLPAPPACPSQQ